MGAFISSAQVFTGDAATTRQAVIAALQAGASGEDPVAVGPTRPEPWIALYPVVGEEPDLARTLSAACACTCVSVTVHDSDLLRLELLVRGETRDVFNSVPEEFPEPDGGGEGSPAKWAPVLAPGRTPFELAGVWGGEEIFAEDLLVQVAEVLGMHPDDVINGQDLFTGELLQPVQGVDWVA